MAIGAKESIIISDQAHSHQLSPELSDCFLPSNTLIDPDKIKAPLLLVLNRIDVFQCVGDAFNVRVREHPNVASPCGWFDLARPDDVANPPGWLFEPASDFADGRHQSSCVRHDEFPSRFLAKCPVRRAPNLILTSREDWLHAREDWLHADFFCFF